MLTIFENACMRGTWALNEMVWRLDKTNANLIWVRRVWACLACNVVSLPSCLLPLLFLLFTLF